MNRSPVLPWILLVLWAAWAQAAQGFFSAATPWAPDLGVVLLLSLAARLPTEHLPKAALAVALGRVVVSVETPTAVFAGLLALTAGARGLRSMLEINGVVARSLIAGLGTWAFAAWLSRVHEMRVLSKASMHTPNFPAAWAEQNPLAESAGWQVPLATAVVALLLGPALARLPGLGPLHRRKAWARDASGR